MVWGLMGIGGIAAVLPLLLWLHLWRSTSRRAQSASTFWDDIETTDRRRQVSVPLALGSGALVAGIAAWAAVGTEAYRPLEPLFVVVMFAGSVLGVIVFPILVLATVTSKGPRWLPSLAAHDTVAPDASAPRVTAARITAAKTRAAKITARTGVFERVILVLFAPFMAFAALGIGSGIKSAWAGLTVAIAWPICDLAARTMRQRLEVRAEGILMTSYARDYRWDAADVESVHVGLGGFLSLRDTAGRVGRSLNTPVPADEVESANARLRDMGYVVDAAGTETRWRPSRPSVMRSRLGQLTTPRVAVLAFCLAEAAWLSIMGVAS